MEEQGQARHPKTLLGARQHTAVEPAGRSGAGEVPDSLSVLLGAFSQLPSHHQAAGTGSAQL